MPAGHLHRRMLGSQSSVDYAGFFGGTIKYHYKLIDTDSWATSSPGGASIPMAEGDITNNSWINLNGTTDYFTQNSGPLTAPYGVASLQYDASGTTTSQRFIIEDLAGSSHSNAVAYGWFAFDANHFKNNDGDGYQIHQFTDGGGTQTAYSLVQGQNWNAGTGRFDDFRFIQTTTAGQNSHTPFPLANDTPAFWVMYQWIDGADTKTRSFYHFNGTSYQTGIRTDAGVRGGMLSPGATTYWHVGQNTGGGSNTGNIYFSGSVLVWDVATTPTLANTTELYDAFKDN